MSIREALNFTPAEAVMLLDPEKADAMKMVTLTFVDLLLRDVMRIDGIDDKGRISNDRAVRILRGENCQKISMKSHEKALAECAPVKGRS